MSDSTLLAAEPQPQPPPTLPTLNFGNIQGDVILGLPKKVEEYVFFKITNQKLFRSQIVKVIPYITTMAQVMQDHEAIKEQKILKPGCLLELPRTNIAFSQTGFTKMDIKTDELGDDHFKKGQFRDAEFLGDNGRRMDDSFVPNWEKEFKELDGVLIFASECRATLDSQIEKIDGILTDCYEVATTIFGNVRPGAQAGHEHFGFLDDISQPGIKGFTKLVKGQTAVDPGVILLGNFPDKRNSVLAKDGSFLAFRKYNQLVPEFNSFLLKNGAGIFGGTPQEGAEFLGARLFGRWKSGAPIDITPFKDNPDLGADDHLNNDFQFDFKNPDDQKDQTRCPFAAHIRKTNPRQDLESPEAANPNRIIRHGIPFGPEVSDLEAKEGATYYDRGLAFGCYQSDLSKGFFFVQKSWSNDPDFPSGKTDSEGKELSPGFDPIIGQAGGGKPRTMIGYDPGAQSKSLFLEREFVVIRGGEYFFVPSIKALREVIACVIIPPAV